jgi:hypothetical protein
MFERLLLSLVLVSPLSALPALADDPVRAEDPEARALAERIAARPDSESRVGVMHFTLINKSGKQRERVAEVAHSDLERTERLLIHFTAPSSIQGTSFITHTHDQQADESWLYLPATERVRRIPASQRADYFLGTDLSYGDIQDNFSFGLEDWVFELLAPVQRDGREWPVLRGHARDDEAADDLGYASFTAVIDLETLFPVEIDYTDPDGVPLKRVEVLQQERIEGIWTATRFTVVNHRKRHRTEVQFSDLRHVPAIRADVFDAESLAFGAPRLP